MDVQNTVSNGSSPAFKSVVTTAICKSVRPDVIFKPFYAMTSDYLISCFYCIIQFGLKKNKRKERGRFREHVRGGGGGGGEYESESERGKI